MSTAVRGLHGPKRVNKVEQTVKLLQDYILGGNLKPGQELPSESEMGERIGVSKFSMREALRVVEAQGLIDICQGRRTRVSSLSVASTTEIMGLTLRRSKSSLLDLVEAREILEGAIARLAAIRAEPAQIKAMEQSILDLDINRENGEICIEKDMEFHDGLVQATKNQVFALMLAPLVGLLRESRRETIRFTGVDRVLKGHQLVLQAVRMKDPDRAEKAMRQHLDEAKEDLRKMGGLD